MRTDPLVHWLVGALLVFLPMRALAQTPFAQLDPLVALVDQAATVPNIPNDGLHAESFLPAPAGHRRR